MEMKWLGTGGFEFRMKNSVFLVDPYFTRNPAAKPFQPVQAMDITQADTIFISHGHFDHLLDVPVIAANTGCRICCSATAAQTLVKKGVSPGQISQVTVDGDRFSFHQFQAGAFFSRHVKFDAKLVLSALIKIRSRLPEFWPLIREYPCGQVLSWRFYAGGKTIHYFGSAGPSHAELAAISNEPIDVLLLPLQGHSQICRIGADIVALLKPHTVVAQHWDDFYPPMSQYIDLQPFIDLVAKKSPHTKVFVPKMNEVIPLKNL